MNTKNIYIYTLFIAVLVILQSCQQAGGDSTGSEYMPDMGHSVAYEANYYNYYGFNTWGTEEEYYKYAQPRLPVKGTVARSIGNSGAIKTYAYSDTEEDRSRAMVELVNNPLPITASGLKEGKELYNLYCSTCHGPKGDGNGYLVRDDGGVYPVSPANFMLDEHITASNGRFYHAIMHGKNMMGGYADKVTYNERWNIIHYIRSLQAKEKKLVYSELENTLNSIDIPVGNINTISKIHTVTTELNSAKQSHSMESNHVEKHENHDTHNDNH
ncbi:MAG: cytochrome c [Saprospiraceae bacterium]